MLVLLGHLDSFRLGPGRTRDGSKKPLTLDNNEPAGGMGSLFVYFDGWLYFCLTAYVLMTCYISLVGSHWPASDLGWGGQKEPLSKEGPASRDGIPVRYFGSTGYIITVCYVGLC